MRLRPPSKRNETNRKFVADFPGQAKPGNPNFHLGRIKGIQARRLYRNLCVGVHAIATMTNCRRGERRERMARLPATEIIVFPKSPLYAKRPIRSAL